MISSCLMTIRLSDEMRNGKVGRLAGGRLGFTPLSWLITRFERPYLRLVRKTPLGWFWLSGHLPRRLPRVF